MATILLQAAGGILGGAFGSFGATVGTAAGALAGYWVDQTLFGKTSHREGARLTQARPMTAEEGAPVPRAYGHARVSGTVIWATRCEEEATTERQGGKGGPRSTVTTYSYFGNVAVALCEGPVALVKRVWTDGRELDLTEIDMRVYTGTADQLSDPLIEARQGAGNAPAYRNIAYLVFERLPLEGFGNRIPQIEAEVIRPVGELEPGIRAVSVIPGATEHGLSPDPATSLLAPGETVEHNRHVLYAGNDWAASIDELQAVCPNLKHVSLVISWFGDDLRAGNCTIRPGVAERLLGDETPAWRVSGLARSDVDARLVSRVDGRPAYGGTPTDQSVIAAIRDLKARGLSVTLHPFVMMDVPQDNQLPDPYGGTAQAAYPWRGRITCFPGPSQPASVDRTAAAESQIASFVGMTQSGDLPVVGEMVVPGPGADWGYRRMVLHMARLAQIAGGVDAMLIGSELRSLTWLRGVEDSFPFVAALQQIAADVRSILGASCKLTYGADWSEFFGYQPTDGSGDVYFHLDSLWSAPEIDAVGIDNYMPLADWRDSDGIEVAGNPDAMAAHDDAAAMQAAITSGEGFDWYYASDADRQSRARTPITDGPHGKPWVYRYKDLVSWWSNAHLERRGGVETGVPSPWVPYGKPIWLTELGSPAVHAGANQPNVFPDAKSSENAQPHFSTGARSDSSQRAFLAAHQRHWADAGSASNPFKPDTTEPMVDPDRAYLWAWDARPFPEFPRNREVWGDGDNWLTGHWLNGRLGGAPLDGLIRAVFADHGLPEPILDGVRGTTLGMTVGAPSSIRNTLEPFVEAFGLVTADTGGPTAPVLRVDSETYRPIEIASELICLGPEMGNRRQTFGQADEVPAEVVVRYRDALTDYRTQSARSYRRDGSSARLADLNLPCTLDGDAARHVADSTLDRFWAGRDALKVELPLRFAGLEPGDVIAFSDNAQAHWRITGIDLTDRLEVTAVSVVNALSNAVRPALPDTDASAGALGMFGGPPDVALLDLPLLDRTAPENNFRIALRAIPSRPQAVLVSPAESGFVARQTVPSNAMMGRLVAPLAPGPCGRYDRANMIDLTLWSGELESVSQALMLSGRNALVVEAFNGLYELVQFRFAEEVAPGQWRLSELLRGQAGTDDAAVLGADSGARVFVIDGRVIPAGLAASETGLALNWRVGPIGRTFSDRYFATRSASGGTRALMPLSPVHLRALASLDGGIELTWIRRSRVAADIALASQVPVGEEVERYAVTLFDANGAAIHSRQTDTSKTQLEPALVLALFGAMPDVIDLEIRQVSATVGPGVPARRLLPVTAP